MANICPSCNEPFTGSSLTNFITLAEFADAVAEMRAAQKTAFVRANMNQQHLEHAVDKLLAAIQNPPAPNLFG